MQGDINYRGRTIEEQIALLADLLPKVPGWRPCEVASHHHVWDDRAEFLLADVRGTGLTPNQQQEVAQVIALALNVLPTLLARSVPGADALLSEVAALKGQLQAKRPVYVITYEDSKTMSRTHWSAVNSPAAAWQAILKCMDAKHPSWPGRFWVDFYPDVLDEYDAKQGGKTWMIPAADVIQGVIRGTNPVEQYFTPKPVVPPPPPPSAGCLSVTDLDDDDFEFENDEDFLNA